MITGFLSRVAAFFKRVFSGEARKNDTALEVQSKFKQFYENMNRDEPLYPSVRQTASLCDDALRVAKQRIRLSARLHDLDEKFLELEAFTRLSNDEIADLKRELERFVSLAGERSMLLNQLTAFDPSLTEMFKLEEDAVVAMPQIVDAEKNQRALRQDLSYLQGEKEELIHERQDMGHTLVFVHRFTVFMVVLFLAVSVLLAFLYIFADWEIFLPTTVLILLVMGIVTLLYMYRRRIRFEMRYNLRKQHRAIDLLNKKNVVYAYYTNYLRFSYKKYQVKNSKMLEHNLKDLGSYKFLINRIDTIRSLMYETEEAIERFLREKKLTGVKTTIENFARTVNLEDKKRYYDEIQSEKQSAERELAELDARHEEIWETLMVLNDRDRSHDRIIETILTTYLKEAGQLFDRLEHQMINKAEPHSEPDAEPDAEPQTDGDL